MKKVFFIVCLAFLICGCSNSDTDSNQQGSSGVKKNFVVNGSMECFTEDSKFTLELSDGQIVKYIDSIDGELSQETIDILNEEYLVGVTDNAVAIARMSEGLRDLGGYCE